MTPTPSMMEAARKHRERLERIAGAAFHKPAPAPKPEPKPRAIAAVPIVALPPRRCLDAIPETAVYVPWVGEDRPVTFSDIKLIAGRYGPFDVALVPCGDRFTMGLDDAAIAAQWLKARVTIPIHYGTFPIIEDNGAALVERIGRSGLPGRALKPGETLEF